MFYTSIKVRKQRRRRQLTERKRANLFLLHGGHMQHPHLECQACHGLLLKQKGTPPVFHEHERTQGCVTRAAIVKFDLRAQLRSLARALQMARIPFYVLYSHCKKTVRKVPCYLEQLYPQSGNIIVTPFWRSIRTSQSCCTCISVPGVFSHPSDHTDLQHSTCIKFLVCTANAWIFEMATLVLLMDYVKPYLV